LSSVSYGGNTPLPSLTVGCHMTELTPLLKKNFKFLKFRFKNRNSLKQKGPCNRRGKHRPNLKQQPSKVSATIISLIN